MQNGVSHFCQKCRAANPPGESSCQKCGTRLMIVTFPSNLRHEEEQTPPSFYEDHLLERVSLLEFRLNQVTEQLAMAYEFISQQSKHFEKDHLLITSFMESVIDVEPDYSQKLAEEFAINYKRNQSERESKNKREKSLDEILSNHKSKNAELFSHLVREGIELLKDNEEKQAFRTLDRACLLSPENVPLHLFIAENFFAVDKFDESETYLERVFKLTPQNTKGLLLQGVIYADKKNAEESRKFLSVLASQPDTMACANYVWGMLAAYEKNWQEAIIAFKESLDAVNSVEINYLIGSAYFQIENFDDALKFLEKAVSKDPGFADAWFMISEIYDRLEKPTKSEHARQMVFEAKEPGAKSLKFMSKNNAENLKCAIPFLHLNEEKKRLLTDGSLRMTRFLRELVFTSIE